MNLHPFRRGGSLSALALLACGTAPVAALIGRDAGAMDALHDASSLVTFDATLSRPVPRASSGGGTGGHGGTQRIIGGAEAPAGKYPYAVYLLTHAGALASCGGSLITRDAVLTAAHCGHILAAAVGNHELTADDVELIDVVQRVPHPLYDPTSSDTDIMVAFLARPVGEDATFVTLNSDASFPAKDGNVTAVGWGDTNPNSAITATSDVLMEVELRALSNEECRESQGTVADGTTIRYEGIVTERMLCAAGDDGGDACSGDSGGPLVVKGGAGGAEDVQVGVTSYGFAECGRREFPGVYTRVSAFYDWIRGEVCRRSAYPPDEFNCECAKNPTPGCCGNSVCEATESGHCSLDCGPYTLTTPRCTICGASSGVMFNVEATSDFVLTSLTFGMYSYSGQIVGDITVYASTGRYENKYSDPELWTEIATQSVSTSTGSLAEVAIDDVTLSAKSTIYIIGKLE